MQRWWYSDDKNNDGDKIFKLRKSPNKRIEGSKKWKFSVVVNFDLNPSDHVALTGSCEELGNWDISGVLLNKEEGEACEKHEIFIVASSSKNFVFIRQTLLAFPILNHIQKSETFNARQSRARYSEDKITKSRVSVSARNNFHWLCSLAVALNTASPRHRTLTHSLTWSSLRRE